MICPNCQYVVSDDHKFCVQCGSALKSPAEKELEQAAVSNMEAKPIYQPGAVQPMPIPPYGGQPIAGTPGLPYPAYPQHFYSQRVITYPPDFPAQLLRKLLRSPLFIIGVISIFIGILCSLADLALISFMGPVATVDGSAGLLTGGTDRWMQILAACSGLVPGILMGVTMVHLLRSVKRSNEYLSRSLGMLNMTVVVAFTASMATSFFSIFVLQFGSLSPDVALEGLSGTDITLFWVGLAVTLLIVYILMGMLYYFVYLGMRNIRQAVDTGRPDAKYSVFTAVMLFIASFGGLMVVCINSLTYLLNGYMETAGVYAYNFGLLDIIELVRGFMAGLANLLFGIVLCRYSRCTKSGVLF